MLRSITKKPAFLFGYVALHDTAEVIQQDAIIGVFTLAQLRTIDKAARAAKKIQEVHIACDALLGREGFLEGELAAVFAAAKKLAHVRVTGMYAHFANIEDTNNFTHAERQIAAFARMKEIARTAGYGAIATHISATSGLLAYEHAHPENTIVRTGIGAYGLWPSEHLAFAYGKKLKLLPVLSWKTHVAQVKTLPAGSTIGYGLTYMTKKRTKVALVPQGYADGYPRTLSNKGVVLVAGKRCPVVGRVAMNMFVIDVSKAPTAAEGDEVVLIGTQGKQHMSAEEVAELSGTINYEATTRISALLPRRLA
jgi:alanine racemase